MKVSDESKGKERHKPAFLVSPGLTIDRILVTFSFSFYPLWNPIICVEVRQEKLTSMESFWKIDHRIK
jgi:hypothetical protein